MLGCIPRHKGGDRGSMHGTAKTTGRPAVGTILQARRVVLVAFGEGKAPVVAFDDADIEAAAEAIERLAHLSIVDPRFVGEAPNGITSPSGKRAPQLTSAAKPPGYSSCGCSA